MTYKSKEKSFFDKPLEKEILHTVADTKEEITQLERKGKRKFLKMYDFGSSKLRDEIKRRPAQYFFIFISTFFGSVVTSAVALFIFSGNIVAQFAVQKPIENVKSVQIAAKPIAQKFDPLLLASKLRKSESDFEIIDIRSASEYMAGHIITSVNLPIYGTSTVEKNGDLDPEAIKQKFRQYMLTDKVLIIYAQNAYSTIPTDIASMLNSSEKSVKALATGWEEWKYLNK